MAIKQASKHCKACNTQVLATKNGPNHILHLILSVCTGGLWVVVWILASLLQEAWRCSRCGKRLSL